MKGHICNGNIPPKKWDFQLYQQLKKKKIIVINCDFVLIFGAFQGKDNFQFKIDIVKIIYETHQHVQNKHL